MKYLKNAFYTAVITFILFPFDANASTSGGGSFGGGVPIVNIGNQFINWFQGPMGMILITLGLIMGGVSVIFGRENDRRGFKRVGWAFVGGSIIVGATSIAGYFFGGAVI